MYYNTSSIAERRKPENCYENATMAAMNKYSSCTSCSDAWISINGNHTAGRVLLFGTRPASCTSRYVTVYLQGSDESGVSSAYQLMGTLRTPPIEWTSKLRIESKE